MKRLGLYLHIPFCIRKCAYCDFLSAPAGEADRISYVQALKKEIQCMGKEAKEYQVDSVFFGGGTPSILEPELLEELLLQLRESFCITKEAEITLEANPGTLTEKKLVVYNKNGINRLSIGLQSADNGELKRLGRIHTWEEFLDNYRLARQLGFSNINIDLMSALPGQTRESYERTLNRVLKLKPEHISAYSLIIEKGTPFYETWEKDELLLPAEEEERQMYYLTERLLKAAGYHRYEISNYAKSGFESRHNNKYWTGEEYLGMGLGASSCFDGRRMKNTEFLPEYLEGIKMRKEIHIENHLLTRREKMEEFMFLGLRRMEGVSKERFFKEFGEELLEVYGETINKQEADGLIAQNEKQLWLTERGIDVSNRVMAEYLF